MNPYYSFAMELSRTRALDVDNLREHSQEALVITRAQFHLAVLPRLVSEDNTEDGCPEALLKKDRSSLD